MINGLVCVYERKRVAICCVCTPEKMRLLDPICFGPNAISSSCYFGYNPVNRVYKLLKLSIIRFGRFSYSQIRQILAVGLGSSWRMLKAAIVETSDKIR